ncbi:hypothetical protein BXY39_3584 [Eilatimonas milleporae]|uniref:Uncharacterized protein n=1 Tax=Eilatimonas milleporae TaxID=911205 RepID=A0A3M0BV07_9PROT|nr:hypothetical protein BXY39_3584 [Eilatimonas milleporae]
MTGLFRRRNRGLAVIPSTPGPLFNTQDLKTVSSGPFVTGPETASRHTEQRNAKHPIQKS